MHLAFRAPLCALVAISAYLSLAGTDPARERDAPSLPSTPTATATIDP